LKWLDQRAGQDSGLAHDCRSLFFLFGAGSLLMVPYPWCPAPLQPGEDGGLRQFIIASNVDQSTASIIHVCPLTHLNTHGQGSSGSSGNPNVPSQLVEIFVVDFFL
jgi:hypothetical protein